MGSKTVDPVINGWLPAPAGEPLIGRESEVALLLELLGQPWPRLVTLTGPAGIGKTRLALHLGHQLSPAFGGRVILVSLATATEPDQVLPAIARTIGLSQTGLPLQERIEIWCDTDPVLLILDNLEHLPGASEQIAELLDRCRTLRILTTSRRSIRIDGERIVPLLPLAVTPPERGVPAQAAPAEALFLRRAIQAGGQESALRAGMPWIVEICRKLDGMPLAIELAAAKSRVWPPAELLARLESPLALLDDGPVNRPDRLRSMRSAVEWSYRLLPPAAQLALRRLSVCEGGFTYRAAVNLLAGWTADQGYPRWFGWPEPARLSAFESIFEATLRAPVATDLSLPRIEIDPAVVLDLLVDHSLIVASIGGDGSPRFQPFEIVKEFAREELDRAGEGDATRHLHALIFMTLAEYFGDHPWTPSGASWTASIVADLGNIRAALTWLLARGDGAVELAMRGAEAIWTFWQTGGGPAEGRRWLEATLPSPDVDPVIRSFGLTAAGALAWFEADEATALARLEEAERVAAANGVTRPSSGRR